MAPQPAAPKGRAFSAPSVSDSASAGGYFTSLMQTHSAVSAPVAPALDLAAEVTPSGARGREFSRSATPRAGLDSRARKAGGKGYKHDCGAFFRASAGRSTAGTASRANRASVTAGTW